MSGDRVPPGPGFEQPDDPERDEADRVDPPDDGPRWFVDRLPSGDLCIWTSGEVAYTIEEAHRLANAILSEIEIIERKKGGEI